MSKYKVGDSFIITIAEVSEGAQSKNPLYRIQGFDSLTFNDRGLDKLDRVRDENADAVLEVQFIEVGDEVIITLHPESPYKAIVTAISTRLIEVIDGYGMSHNIDTFLYPNIIEKTGKKYDISKMLRDLRGILP